MNSILKYQSWIWVAIVIIFLGGGAVGGFLKPAQTSCTLKGCPCIIGTLEEGNLKFLPLASGERPCNECSTGDHVFFTGIINLTRSCQATEMIQCRNGKEKGMRLEVNEESCKYNFSFLSF